MRPLGLIGVPSSAGAHGPGQEKAPAALRAAGLVQRMRDSGLELEELGDLPLVRFQPDPRQPKGQSRDRVVAVARAAQERVDTALQSGLTPIVLGGDCTITLGVTAGMVRHQADLGLVYFDGDVDLKTPATGHSGIFDSMGMAHLTGHGEAELSHLGGRFPLMPEDRIALFGFHPHEVEGLEVDALERSAMLKYPVTEIQPDPAAAAARVVAELERRAEAILVHFDVDAMDSAEIPLADWPHYDALSLDEAMRCLRVFAASPKFAGLVLTEINPDHDPDGTLLRRFVQAFADALRPATSAAPLR